MCNDQTGLVLYVLLYVLYTSSSCRRLMFWAQLNLGMTLYKNILGFHEVYFLFAFQIELL
jgi:hypothetical protein